MGPEARNSYKTAWKWWKAGILPVRARQLLTGTILVEEEAVLEAEGEVVIYARVSSADPKGDLDRQVARLVGWTTERRLRVDRVVTETASGLNGRRRRLRALLAYKGRRYGARLRVAPGISLLVGGACAAGGVWASAGLPDLRGRKLRVAERPAGRPAGGGTGGDARRTSTRSVKQEGAQG